MFSRILFYIFLIALGAGLGAYAFSDTQRRQVIKFENCDPVCFTPNEALGLLTSIGVRYATGFIPDLLFETDKTLAIKHPTSKSSNHYLIIPKKDIKNIAEIQEEDEPYVLDAMAVIKRLIADNNLDKYQVVTNGPGFQDATYLHFHLVAE